MIFEVRIAPRAERHIDEFATYLRQYSVELAAEQIQRLNRILFVTLAEAPLTWAYFPLTGPPYRAYLFRVGRLTQFWIIYVVNETEVIVDVLEFWNTRRDPATLRSP
jgi:hypothetical protein